MDINNTTTYPTLIMPWVATGVYNDRLNAIQIKHALQGNKEDGFYSLAKDVMQRTLPLERIPEVARASLFITQQEAMLLARDIVGYLVWPVAIIFYDKEDVLDYLEQWGGREDDYPLPDNMKEILDDMSDWFEYEEVENIFAKIEKEEEIKSKSQVNTNTEQSSIPVDPEKLAISEKDLSALWEQAGIKEAYQHILNPETEKQIKKFHSLYEQDNDDFTKQFYLAINDRNIDEVVAALWSLAERGKLLHLLLEDKKISTLLSKHLEKKFNQQTADHFEENKDGVGYLAYFLRHLLVDTLKITESDSAALVIHLSNQQSNTTGVESEMMAYGDIKTNKFMWREIINKDDKLILR